MLVMNILKIRILTFNGKVYPLPLNFLNNSKKYLRILTIVRPFLFIDKLNFAVHHSRSSKYSY